MPADPLPPPARFRRRLLAVMLVTELAPLLLLGLLAREALQELLSVSLAPVEQVLDDVSTELVQEGRSPVALDEARLNLAQAESSPSSSRSPTPPATSSSSSSSNSIAWAESSPPSASA
jgi:two-component system, NtrC family, nitrogen regulation sensor histidine kinase NtrY